ncbi:Fic/DOC family protein [Gordonia humi]|uniref:protein adenylyltransferase n=1 Tax=Gordonia humi TaxID=686429 RepID=A0A840F8Z1_9ACTN|nr:Fic family protein [Gordonia humi]MBB4138069.1 fido (protein-threonine AMPylation protein) [Gordonia humi]
MINLDLPHHFGPDPDPAKVEAFERRMTAIRLAQIERDPWQHGHTFDLGHLQNLHHQILQDCYPWSGTLRTDVRTEAMGIEHCPPEHVADYAAAVTDHMAATPPPVHDGHAALDLAAEHWANLTYLHAFADGNSRTQRAFIQLYLRSGDWDLDWSQLDPELIHAARHIAVTDDPHNEQLRDHVWLSAALEPGLVPYGHGSALNYPAYPVDGNRPVAIFITMLEAKEHGIDPHTYFRDDHTEKINETAATLARLQQLEQQ